MSEVVIGLVLLIALYLLIKKGGLSRRRTSALPAPPEGSGATPTVPATGLSTATQVMSTETLNAGNASGLIIWLPNESHEPVDKRLSEKNGVFLPLNATVGTGASVVFVSDDASHTPKVTLEGVGSTTGLPEGGNSQPLKFTKAGSFAMNTSESQGERSEGKITVTASPVAGSTIVGAFFCPSGDKAAFEKLLTDGKLKKESEAPAGSEVCIVYSGTGDITAAAKTIGAIAKKTPYT